MKKTVLLLIAALLIPTAVVQAQVITIGIEAIVDGVSDSGNYLEGNISAGDLITGSYTYDTSTLDTNASGTVGDYWHYSQPYGVSLSVGGFVFATDSSNVEFLLEMVNDQDGDAYLFLSDRNSALANGVLVDSIHWQLDDYSEQAISSTDLLTTAPILADWPDGNRLSIRGDKLTSYFTIGAHFTSVQVIPEPATIAIFAFGLAFIGKRRKTN